MAHTTENPRAIVLTKTVSPTGQITGLKTFAGRDVLVVPLPKLPDAATPAKAAAKDITQFAQAHADLARKQAKQFLQRHGNPVEKAQAQAERLRKEIERRYSEVRVRVRTGKARASGTAKAQPKTKTTRKPTKGKTSASVTVAPATGSENGAH